MNYNVESLEINIDGKLLERKLFLTYLGVVLDENLKFDKHTQYLASKIGKSIGIINRMKDMVPQSVLYNLYYSLIYPYLKYCNVVWCGTYWCHLNSLWLLQKRAMRVIRRKPPSFHTNLLFLESKILKVSDIHSLYLGIFMYKNGPSMFSLREHQYNIRSQDQVNPLFSRLTTTRHSVFYSGPTTWNNIPPSIRNSLSLFIFKRSFKSYLISQYTTD